LHGLKDQVYNIHLKASSHVIRSLQKLQTLQFKLREHETLSRHLCHDNVVLQAKMNSLQRLVDDMTATNNSLWMKLKHHKRPKSKSPGKGGEDSKANPPPPSQV
jgi:metal-responsive CopG/Arc/MetJ family transcriptional regulator